MREWLAAAIGSIFLAGSSTGAALPRNDKQMGRERPASSTKQIQAIDVACINAAVVTRETTLGTVVSTKQQSDTDAFAARATALASAYSGTDAKVIKASVKKAWDTFAAAQKNATQTYKRSRDNTWKTYRDALKACKGSETVSDARNSSMEQ